MNENTDFNGIDFQSLDIEHHNFVNALNFVLEGGFSSAENIFKELYVSSNDSLIRKYSKQILVSILFFQSKWGSLISLSSETNEPSDSELVLARAYDKAPKEIYSFPSRPITIPTSSIM